MWGLSCVPVAEGLNVYSQHMDLHPCLHRVCSGLLINMLPEAGSKQAKDNFEDMVRAKPELRPLNPLTPRGGFVSRRRTTARS